MGQQVYDPVLKRLVTDVEADALNAQRRQHAEPQGTVTFDPNAEHGFLGFKGPQDDQRAGVDLPPMAREDAEQLMKMFPMLGGLVAQFIPGGKAASFAVPTGIAMIQQLLNGEELDPLDASIEGVKGFAANRVGGTIAGVGAKGRDMVTRALALKGANKTDQAIETLTDLAIKEGAEMTPEGAAAIRAAGRTTLPSGAKVTSKAHTALADTMDNARLDFETAPNRITFWPQEALANAIRQAPRELAIGRRMANPFGNVMTESHIAPSVEALMRLKLMQMAGQSEPDMQTSRGPVRRRLK